MLRPLVANDEKKIFLLEVNSEMFPGIKNVIVFSGQFLARLAFSLLSRAHGRVLSSQSQSQSQSQQIMNLTINLQIQSFFITKFSRILNALALELLSLSIAQH